MDDRTEFQGRMSKNIGLLHKILASGESAKIFLSLCINCSLRRFLFMPAFFLWVFLSKYCADMYRYERSYRRRISGTVPVLTCFTYLYKRLGCTSLITSSHMTVTFSTLIFRFCLERVFHFFVVLEKIISGRNSENTTNYALKCYQYQNFALTERCSSRPMKWRQYHMCILVLSEPGGWSARENCSFPLQCKGYSLYWEHICWQNYYFIFLSGAVFFKTTHLAARYLLFCIILLHSTRTHTNACPHTHIPAYMHRRRDT